MIGDLIAYFYDLKMKTLAKSNRILNQIVIPINYI